MVELSRCAAGRRYGAEKRLAPSESLGNTLSTTRKGRTGAGYCNTRSWKRPFHKSLLPKGRQKSNLHIYIEASHSHRARSTMDGIDAPHAISPNDMLALSARAPVNSILSG